MSRVAGHHVDARPRFLSPRAVLVRPAIRAALSAVAQRQAPPRADTARHFACGSQQDGGRDARAAHERGASAAAGARVLAGQQDVRTCQQSTQRGGNVDETESDQFLTVLTKLSRYVL